MSKSQPMKFPAIHVAAFCFVGFSGSIASGQTFAPTPAKSSEGAQLQALAKKIDEQNAKIDTLSQQILKLQQQLANMRPGIMIGEGATSPSASASPVETPRPANGNTHVVERGETLTSIAKVHGITVGELQRYNHIENPLKLQAGQTLLIPTSPSPVPSASSSGE